MSHSPVRALVCALALLCSACVVRPLDKPDEQVEQQCSTLTPQFTDKAVDILFVVDNSESMKHEQANLAQQFPRLIGALRSPKLGGKLPNIRIGVVSTDLGTGGSGPCSPGGDGARLQRTAKAAGCTATPKEPWISYQEGKTNVRNSKAKDPVAQIQQAFSCVAQLGISGCGFEQPLEVARRALDPVGNVNPGFLRNNPAAGNDALLAVIFITDEDDCSAANPQLFDRNQGAFGPFTSFRCFSHGVTCDCTGGACPPGQLGPRKKCRPSGKHLHNVKRYIDFFKNLKKTPDGKQNYSRVIMAAIAGDTDRVNVAMEDGAPTVNARCGNGFPAKTAPAIRLKHLVHAFAHELSPREVAAVKAGKKVPYFVDAKGTWREENFTTICSADFSTALRRIGETIVANLGTVCLDPPPLTDNGGVVCSAGDELGRGPGGKPITCEKSCLDMARFTVQEVSSSGRRPVKKCPARLFDPASKKTDCGDACPCWRVIPHSGCRAQQKQGLGTSPYAVEIMRRGKAPKGTYLSVDSLCAATPWGSADFSSLPQCY